MAELTVNDIIQQYDKTVVLHKGSIAKVKQVGAEIKLLDLNTQKTKVVPFVLKDFNSPILRLGYVNCDETAIYVARRPVRMFKVGISNENCTFTSSEGAQCPNNVRGIVEKVKAMECREFAQMMLGHYPSIKDAWAQTQKFGGCVAFDRQFAIDAAAKIYFKGKRVGNLMNDKTGEILFNRGLEYLELMIGNNYEKASRTFGQKAA